MGNDHTLFTKIDGYVKYERLGRDKKQVSVYETIQFTLSELKRQYLLSFF